MTDPKTQTVAQWVAEGGQIKRLPPPPQRPDREIDHGYTAQRSWSALRRAGQDNLTPQEKP